MNSIFSSFSGLGCLPIKQVAIRTGRFSGGRCLLAAWLIATSLASLGWAGQQETASISTSQSHLSELRQDQNDRTTDPEQGGDAEEGLNWVKMRPTGALAEFEMPHKPRYVERTFTPVIGRYPIKVRLYQTTAHQGSIAYVFSYHDMLDRPKNLKAINQTLVGAMRGSLVNVKGQMLKAPRELKYGGGYGREFMYGFRQQEKDFVGISRVFLLRQRQYQLTVVMSSSAAKVAVPLANKFLNSFRRVKPESDLPPVPRKK